MERKIMVVKESLYEFAKSERGKGKRRKKKTQSKSDWKFRGIDTSDKWEESDEEETVLDDVDTSDMENADSIEVEEDVFDDELIKALNNEIKIPEFNRRTLVFRLKGDLEKVISGVPMAKLGNNAFLFKLENGSLKKIFLKDIITEQEKKNKNRARFINE
jgi:hypothetical protein